MSGIGGVYNADGKPVDQELLERMRNIIAHRGPDGSGIWVNGKVGFAHRLLWTTEESVHEKQPMTNDRGLWITADCRIDNRDELKSKFQAQGMWNEMQKLFHPHPPPDSAYILFAYELWKEDSPLHLLGDFSFAIWDERDEKLFCARDPIGLKPFVYHWNGKTFLFGSEIKQIFQEESVPDDIHTLHLAEILARTLSNREETPYRAIRRLLPAHSLSLHHGEFRMKRYWNWDPDREPVSQLSFEENSELFLGLFSEAVRARLRTPPTQRAGSLLSGGLDSSSIVSMASSMTNRLPGASPFPVFTLNFPEANQGHQFKNWDWVDESPYYQPLVEKYGLDSHVVEIRGFGPFENLEENLWRQEVPPFFPNLAYFIHLFETIRDRGVRVLLHGEGGDEIFLPGSRCFVQDLKRGRLGKFIHEVVGRKEKWGIPYGRLFATTLRTLLPEWTKIPYRRFFRRRVPAWVNPRFARRHHLRERIEKEFFWNPKFHGSPSYGIWIWLKTNQAPLYLETLERTAAGSQLEMRLPFLDLRILRFLATLPWDQKRSNGVSKRLLREALKDFLPPQIRNRWRKSEFFPVIQTGFERYAMGFVKETVENPHPLLGEMTSPGRIRSLYEGHFHGGGGNPSKRSESIWFFWYLVWINQWLNRQKTLLKKYKEEGPYEKKATSHRHSN